VDPLIGTSLAIGDGTIKMLAPMKVGVMAAFYHAMRHSSSIIKTGGSEILKQANSSWLPTRLEKGRRENDWTNRRYELGVDPALLPDHQ